MLQRATRVGPVVVKVAAVFIALTLAVPLVDPNAAEVVTSTQSSEDAIEPAQLLRPDIAPTDDPDAAIVAARSVQPFACRPAVRHLAVPLLVSGDSDPQRLTNHQGCLPLRRLDRPAAALASGRRLV